MCYCPHFVVTYPDVYLSPKSVANVGVEMLAPTTRAVRGSIDKDWAKRLWSGASGCHVIFEETPMIG
jgi:hypothetical protein